MNNESASQFGERMSIEQFLARTRSSNLDVYPRQDKPGYYYFSSENALGYVPKALGEKIDYINEHKTEIAEKRAKGEELDENEVLGRLFITEVTTEGHNEPMFMLCESKRESILHFSLD